MSDYNVIIDYAPKDALNTGDPDKLILGTELAAEFAAIAAAVTTKYDSTDLATQAQAEAGASGSVLMTPLRVQQWAAYNAGMVADIQALADPGADAFLYWDDVAGAVQALPLGAGLDITAGALVVDLTELDLSTGFAADEIIDHTTVIVTAGDGLIGGGDISASFSLALSINTLSALAALDEDNDQIAVYDASEGTHHKTPLSAFRGVALGDGQWYRSTTQALTANTAATLICGVERYNELTRGTYDTSTGIYTAGADGARLWVSAGLQTASMAKGGVLYIRVLKDATVLARQEQNSDKDSNAGPYSVEVNSVVTLAAGETCKIQAECTKDVNTNATSGYVYFNIIELA